MWLAFYFFQPFVEWARKLIFSSPYYLLSLVFVCLFLTENKWPLSKTQSMLLDKSYYSVRSITRGLNTVRWVSYFIIVHNILQEKFLRYRGWRLYKNLSSVLSHSESTLKSYLPNKSDWLQPPFHRIHCYCFQCLA